MVSTLLLVTVTLLYAGYNLLIKVSASQIPAEATSTILATVCLQIAALGTSMAFIAFLVLRGGHSLALPSNAYLWAAAAGLCIGGAEIAYFYLFGGIGGVKPMAATVAVPVIVSGTIVITMVVGYLVFNETLSWRQLIGAACIVTGIAILFLGNDAMAK
jgi:drug/metabolite transporter (DMT)-like permease